jgi:hypothetical protein
MGGYGGKGGPMTRDQLRQDGMPMESGLQVRPGTPGYQRLMQDQMRYNQITPQQRQQQQQQSMIAMQNFQNALRGQPQTQSQLQGLAALQQPTAAPEQPYMGNFLP